MVRLPVCLLFATLLGVAPAWGQEAASFRVAGVVGGQVTIDRSGDVWTVVVVPERGPSLRGTGRGRMSGQGWEVRVERLQTTSDTVGLVGRLPFTDPAPVTAREGVPAKLRLERRGDRVRLALYDAAGKNLGVATGTVDREAEVRRLQDRLEAIEAQRAPARERDEARHALEAARRAQEDEDHQEITSQDPARVHAAVERLQDRLAQLEARAEAAHRATGRVPQPLLDDRAHTERLLAVARRERDELDHRAITSGDPATTQAAVERLQDRLARLETRADAAHRATGRAPQPLLDDRAHTERLLAVARREREELDHRAITSGDPATTQAAVERLQDRLAGLEARADAAHRATGRAPQPLLDDRADAERLLAVARRERDELDHRAIASGDPAATQAAVERLQDRLAQLEARADAAHRATGRAPQPLLDDRADAERLLAIARRERDELDHRAIASGDPAATRAVVERLQERLRRLERRAQQATGPAQQVLLDDATATRRLLEVARSERR
ncbi:MAG: hypothetical protein M9894_12950 [Planctomycetes bacterium]|nr:hypothetical protein [Planctomycetota bacterium]